MNAKLIPFLASMGALGLIQAPKRCYQIPTDNSPEMQAIRRKMEVNRQAAVAEAKAKSAAKRARQEARREAQRAVQKAYLNGSQA